MTSTSRAVKILRSLARGNKVSQRRAIAALADLLGAHDPDTVEQPAPMAGMVLIVFDEYKREHRRAPAVRDIGRVLGKCPATIHEHLDTLVRRKFLNISSTARTSWRNRYVTRKGKRWLKTLEESDTRTCKFGDEALQESGRDASTPTPNPGD